MLVSPFPILDRPGLLAHSFSQFSGFEPSACFFQRQYLETLCGDLVAHDGIQC